MQKNTLLAGVWVGYMGALAVTWYLRLSSPMLVILAVVGGMVGFLLPILLDILLPKMMNGTARVDTTFAKDLLRDSATAIRQGEFHLTDAPVTPLRSYPLLAAYVAAAIFVITSTQNWFGRGFVMGLGLSLVADVFLSRSPETLRRRWFSVFRTTLTDAELRYFVLLVLGVFGVLSLLAALA